VQVRSFIADWILEGLNSAVMARDKGLLVLRKIPESDRFLYSTVVLFYLIEYSTIIK
jgi:serine phosphatase RsbU (regulator of sigma subunit)